MIDYKAILDKAWQQHIALKKPNAPTVVSTFSGCGGSSLGYSMAGYKELLAIDWDENALANFRLNFPGVPTHYGDIRELTVKQCLELANVEVGQLDLLDGSPPCQGFSTAGKRDLEDRRNQLYVDYCRLLEGLKPRTFVMENVSGLVRGKMKLVFADITKSLKDCGYNVRCLLMNAMYFYVPQSRQRLIWLGIRNDLGIDPTFPKPQSKPITIKQAVPWIRRITYDPHGQFDPAHRTRNEVCMSLTKGGYHFFVEPETDIARFAIGKEWDKVRQGEQSERYFSLVKASLDKPSPTVTKTGGVSESVACVVHLTEKRKFSIAELKRIGAFPDQFEMVGSYADRWSVIGNSVPPLFMRALATHIRTEVLDHADDNPTR